MNRIDTMKYLFFRLICLSLFIYSVASAQIPGSSSTRDSIYEIAIHQLCVEINRNDTSLIVQDTIFLNIGFPYSPIFLDNYNGIHIQYVHSDYSALPDGRTPLIELRPMEISNADLVITGTVQLLIKNGNSIDGFQDDHDYLGFLFKRDQATNKYALSQVYFPPE